MGIHVELKDNLGPIIPNPIAQWKPSPSKKEYLLKLRLRNDAVKLIQRNVE